jgi:hypothetical protein
VRNDQAKAESDQNSRVPDRHQPEARVRWQLYASASDLLDPPGTEYCRKCTWKQTPKVEYDAGELAEALAQAEDRVLFFLDTSLFDTETDPRVWDALLAHKSKLVLIPAVRRELQPWIDEHADHAGAKAVTGDSSAFVEKAGIDPGHQTTVSLCDYYISLLASRKRAFELLDAQFELAHGRPPNDEERRALRVASNNMPSFRPRAHLLAKKGEKDAGSPNFYTDEALVTLAAVWGLERRREIVILTKDEDLQEQHYKLLYLMDTHYRAMLFAERYRDDPGQLRRAPIPDRFPTSGGSFRPVSRDVGRARRRCGRETDSCRHLPGAAALLGGRPDFLSTNLRRRLGHEKVTPDQGQDAGAKHRVVRRAELPLLARAAAVQAGRD